jgi:hypothetical protein
MYAEVPEKNVDSFMDRIEEGNVIMTPAAPLTPSSNLAGNSSNPSASVGVSPEVNSFSSLPMLCTVGRHASL